jgi:hypothetical protein
MERLLGDALISLELLELGPCLRVGAQIPEHLAQAGHGVFGAIDRAVLLLRVVEAVLPRAVGAGNESQRLRDMPKPPDAAIRPACEGDQPCYGAGTEARRHSDARANALAAGTTIRRSSGDSACRSTHAGASPSRREFEPKNHASTVGLSYAAEIILAAV